MQIQLGLSESGPVLSLRPMFRLGTHCAQLMYVRRSITGKCEPDLRPVSELSPKIRLHNQISGYVRWVIR